MALVAAAFLRLLVAARSVRAIAPGAKWLFLFAPPPKGNQKGVCVFPLLNGFLVHFAQRDDKRGCGFLRPDPLFRFQGSERPSQGGIRSI